MFRMATLPDRGWFDRLSSGMVWDHVAKGRKGAILTSAKDENSFYLVRSTTKYQNPTRLFRPVHVELLKEMADAVKLSSADTEIPHLNNAMIELYTHEYSTMGFHTDQSLDLEENSWICLFSTYRRKPTLGETRVLRIEDKETRHSMNFLLAYNEMVCFNTDTNHRARHCIILPDAVESDNKWLGVTARTAKTVVSFDPEGVPRMGCQTGEPLRLATKEEKQELCKMKSAENREISFAYPDSVAYTLSPGDLKRPVI